jgi:hypothetical protein
MRQPLWMSPVCDVILLAVVFQRHPHYRHSREGGKLGLCGSNADTRSREHDGVKGVLR